MTHYKVKNVMLSIIIEDVKNYGLYFIKVLYDEWINNIEFRNFKSFQNINIKYEHLFNDIGF